MERSRKNVRTDTKISTKGRISEISGSRPDQFI